MQQYTDEQMYFDIGVILYSKNEDFRFEKQIADFIDSLREYSNEFVLHPKHIHNLEYDSVFPQIMACFQGKDDEYRIERIEELNYDQLNAMSEGKLLSVCNELSAMLYERFRQRTLSCVGWAARSGPLLVIADGDFLEVVSEIKGINGFRSNCVVVGLSDNYWCCYDKEYDDINRIHYLSQIADVLLFHRYYEDYRFPVADALNENTDDSINIDVEDWL